MPTTNFIFSTIKDCSCLCVTPPQTIDSQNNWSYQEYDLDNFVTGLSAGCDSVAAIKTDGTLWSWGSNCYGKIGNNNITNQSSPVQTISTGTNWKQIDAGRFHSAAIKTDGTLWLWGGNFNGTLGNNSTIPRSSPVQTVSTGTNWKQAATHTSHSAAVKTDGTLWLWGYGRWGRLGNNSTIRRSSPVQTVSTGTDWKQVSLGCCHSVAIKTDGTLWSWGEGVRSQLGDNNTIEVSSPVQTVSTGTDWKQVSAGDFNSAAVKTNGTLWLWGCNGDGRLGRNNTIDQSSPVQTVSTGNNWKQVSLGAFHSAAIKTDGTLWLWGQSCEGKLGNDCTTDFSSPIRNINQSSPVQTVSTGTNWKHVSLGSAQSAALKTDGTLWLWGSNSCGALAVNFFSFVPKRTEFDDVFVRREFFIESGLWGWGNNCIGQTGTNNTINYSSPIQTISTGTNWREVSSASGFSAGIKTDGTLWLWGVGACGTLGDNTTISRSSPVQTISTGTDWKQLSVGARHSAAIKTDGTLWLWGQGGSRLGTNSTINRSSPVQTVSTGTNWKQVSIGILDHSAAVKTDGTLWLWGNGTGGVLGNNSTINHSSPVQTVSTGTDWKQVGLGDSHSAAVKTDGTLWLWGFSQTGLLGNSVLGGTGGKSSPVQTVSQGTNWKQVEIGVDGSAAVKTDGTLWLWGKNSYGQLGTNNTVDYSSPVQSITTGTSWVQVSVGCDTVIALREDYW